MIVILKNRADADELDNLVYWLKEQGIGVRPTVGSQQTILGLVGDTSRIDMDLIAALDIVESVKRVQEPFKYVNRKFHPEDTVITVGDVKIGGGSLAIFAGPNAVESEEMLMETAKAVQAGGAGILVGGAFKSRSSPYAFQGLGIEGLRLLMKAKEETGLPVMSEIMDGSQLPAFEDVDILAVGAGNMQNYALLRDLGRCRKPVLLRRNPSATYEEFLMSAEYIVAGGNDQVILCERGVRTFENYTRGTLDVTAVPVLKSLTHLPVVVDPSHACGKYALVPALTAAAVAAGADGVCLDVHNDPAHALCGGPQSLTTDKFKRVAEKLRGVAEAVR